MAMMDNLEVTVGATTKEKDSMEHIKDAFKKDFMNEIEDCNKYCDMAMCAEKKDDEILSNGLYAIAWDEYTHAKFIHNCLVDWGCEIPEKEILKWHELKERVERIFHRK